MLRSASHRPFMELKVELQCSRGNADGLCPELYAANTHPSTLFLED
jgi:hypothetical protein